MRTSFADEKSSSKIQVADLVFIKSFWFLVPISWGSSGRVVPPCERQWSQPLTHISFVWTYRTMPDLHLGHSFDPSKNFTCCYLQTGFYDDFCPDKQKRWLGNMNMTTYCDVANRAQQIQTTTICLWMKTSHEHFLRTPLVPLNVSSYTAFEQMHLWSPQAEWYLFLSIKSLNSAGSNFKIIYQICQARNKLTIWKMNWEFWFCCFQKDLRLITELEHSDYNVASWQP